MRHLTFKRCATHVACALALFAAALTNADTETLEPSRPFTLTECWRALDRAALYADDVDNDTAQQGFTSLAQSCESLPQVHHNIGVIAARRGQWEIAIQAFDAAIELYPLTADTVNQLRSLHEYQAKQAWQVALKLDTELSPPRFTLQTSRDQNQAIAAQPDHDSGLRSVTTIDFELYTWWHASTDSNDKAAWLNHYVKGYPAQVIPDAQVVNWNDVRRDIRFTAQDAVAVLSWDHAGKTQHRMLLMSLAGERWQIYHEASL